MVANVNSRSTWYSSGMTCKKKKKNAFVVNQSPCTTAGVTFFSEDGTNSIGYNIVITEHSWNLLW